MINSSSSLVSKAYVATFAGLLAITPGANAKNIVLSDIQSSVSSSYQGDYYSPKASTSEQDAPLHITQDMLFNAEIEKFKQLISNKFNTNVTATWVPAKDLEEKTCLFIKCDLQDELNEDFEKLSEFELNLYLTFKDTLKDSDFFNMIAVL
jgi:hypothetical protein